MTGDTSESDDESELDELDDDDDPESDDELELDEELDESEDVDLDDEVEFDLERPFLGGLIFLFVSIFLVITEATCFLIGVSSSESESFRLCFVSFVGDFNSRFDLEANSWEPFLSLIFKSISSSRLFLFSLYEWRLVLFILLLRFRLLELLNDLLRDLLAGRSCLLRGLRLLVEGLLENDLSFLFFELADREFFLLLTGLLDILSFLL